MGLAPGETFGRYRIDKVLGAGGMGRVVAAHDTVLERPVALKIILPERASREEAIARFFREAKLAARLTHPNTVRIYDLGEHEGTVFIVMERIEGASLRDRVNGGASVETKLQWLIEVARGLHAAHVAGLVHRDVKPSNVMVDEHDVAKVVDFGLAKRFTVTPEQRATFHTKLGFVVGTPSFVSPEQLLELEPDGRADQFSWGVTAYSVLSGRDPRANDPSFAGQRLSLDVLVPDLPRGIAKIIDRTLAWERDDRFASMEVLASEIGRALTAPVTEPLSLFAEEPARARVGKTCASAIHKNGVDVVVFGDAGIEIFEKNRWRSASLAGLKKPWVVRSAYYQDDHTIIWGGLDGRIARYLLDSGAGERLVTGPLAAETTFAAIDGGQRSCVLAGFSRDGHGAVVHVDGGSVELRTSLRPLTGIARAPDGLVWVCGAGGLLGSLDESGVPQPIDGHGVAFRSIVVARGEVVAGGEEGIVSVDRAWATKLDTTATRISVLAASGAELWAGATDGSIFRRERSEWRQKHKAESGVLALRVGSFGVTAVLQSGAILRGALPR